jgi:hypothetical protein
MLIGENAAFVLIDCGSGMIPSPGEAMKAMRNGAETAILRSNGENRKPFAIADVVKGKPAQGDEVFW